MTNGKKKLWLDKRKSYNFFFKDFFLQYLIISAWIWTKTVRVRRCTRVNYLNTVKSSWVHFSQYGVKCAVLQAGAECQCTGVDCQLDTVHCRLPTGHNGRSKCTSEWNTAGTGQSDARWWGECLHYLLAILPISLQRGNQCVANIWIFEYIRILVDKYIHLSNIIVQL